MKSTLCFARPLAAPLISAGLLAVILFASGPAKAQVVTFPDPSLEAAVTNALGIGLPVYVTNMLTLSNLPAPSYGIYNIQNLTGLETAVNLTNLDFSYSQVTNLSPIAGLTKLTQLHLPWNHVLEVSSLAGLTNLFLLDIGGNRGPSNSSITNIAVLAGMQHLQWLSLYYLSVADLSPLTGLTMLTNLDVSWNFTPTNFGALNGLTNLFFLHLTTDNASNIIFVAHMPRLQDLDFGNNYVHDLSPALGRNLTALQAYNNYPLTNASLVVNFTNLAHLSLGSDGLTNLSFLGSLSNLQELWIDGNPGATSITPVLGLTNLWHLDVDGGGFTNLAALAALTNLSNLEMNNLVTAPDISFLGQMLNLNSLDLGYDHVGALGSLTNLNQLGNLILNGDFLADISPLLLLPNLYYVDLTYNLLDTNVTSAAYNVITNLQNNYVNVDYDPQNISPSLTVWDSPADDCIAIGGMAYFGVAASTTDYNTVTYQWQFNGTDLAGQTNNFLLLTSVGTNQAGVYRAVLSDGNGYAASATAQLFVGDTNCGQTVKIVQQPINAVAAPGEDASFSVTATSSLPDLYYQWLFNGTNISGDNVSGATNATLTLSSVDFSASGIYQVLAWDDASNVVASDAVQLKVVDVVPFTDPNLSNQVVSALGFPPGTAIHLTNLDELTQLNINYKGITNISGLDCARSLNRVDLGNNPIGDASPLGWDSTLQYLYLNNCGLEDASFVSGLTNLIELDLSDNTIHSIPDMQNLAGTLQWLQINENGPLIYYFRVAVLTNLYSLGLHDAGLYDIAFTTGMMQLQSLDVGGDWIDDGNRNFISDISPLISKSQMTWLSLNYDQVTNIPILAALTNFTALWLSSNHFGNIDFIVHMTNLQQLAINITTVTNIAPVTNHLPLNYLDVSYILTTNMSYVSGLTNLGTLWTGGNHTHTADYATALTNVSWLGLELDDITNLAPLAALSNLFYVVLENNRLTNVSILAGKTNLNYLYLSGNQLHDLTPLAGLGYLQNLSLNLNGLTNLAPLAGLTNLSSLLMQSNYIHDVTPLAGLTNLNNLDLSANQITNPSPLNSLHKLSWLGLWQNNLTTLPSLMGLSNVTSLDFSRNPLTNASALSGMTWLTWLSFNQDQFTTAPALTGLPNLNTIDLGSNHVSDVSGLTGLPNLNWLYLYDNNLSTIHPLTSLTHLYYVDVHDNWLDLTPGSTFLTDVATLNGNNTYVNYIPQFSLLLGSPVMSGPKHFSFNIYSPAGDVLQVSRSSDLGSWSSLGTFTNTSGTNVFTDTNATSAALFYRAQQ